MENEEIQLSIAEFYAFGLKNQRVYLNKDLDYIESELSDICNTNKLISITNYSAKIIDVKNFEVKND
jgi:hypothetical protein